MKACVQRVSNARVTVGDELTGEIAMGLVVLLGIGIHDSVQQAHQMAAKIVALRVFDDAQGKMNLAVTDVGGAVLAVSQFTLCGDCRKGRRPSFLEAARPEVAEPLYEEFVAAVRDLGVEVAKGRFRQHMHLTLTNDGPVTLLLEV